MKRKYLLFVLAIILIASVALLFKGSSGKSTAFKSSYKEINVVMDDNYPPYYFRDSNGALKGILIDQWKLWEKKTGIKVNITAMNWDDALDRMENHQYDVIDTIFMNTERESIFDFTKPYVKIDVPIFFNKNISGITDIDSLKGFVVAVKKGDACEDFLKNRGVRNIIEFSSYEDIIKAAKDKSVVVFAMDKPPALYYMYKEQIEGSFNYTAPLYVGEFHRAVIKGNEELLNTVESGFSLISDKEYSQIEKKWYGTSSFINEYEKYMNFFKYIVPVSILIILLLALWNYLLNKMVRSKTSELESMMTELKTVIKTIPDFFFILNSRGVFVEFLSEENSKYLPSGYFIGKCAYDIFSPEISENFRKIANELISTGKTQIYEFPLNIKSELLYFEVRLVNFGEDKILALVRDITQKKIADKKIFEMSMFDALTGLYNRNHFENEIKRFKEEKLINVGLAICDIDGLKLVNDTMGHAVGDKYIILTSEILRTCFRKDDIIARIGGDEFAVLMKDTNEEEIDIIKKTVKMMTDRLNIGNSVVPVSISLGYAVLKDKSKTVDDIFKAADDYMYREKLYNLQSPRSKNIELLVKMLEARDFLTEDHGERLMGLAVLLSRAAGLSENEIKDIKLLAQFHDIGKIGIPDAILFKPEKLTNEERIIMKRHTDIGYRIAQTSPDIMHISDWILKHHERWDGGGYPFGLKGKEIPIQCRIISIVDSFDAMTNDRPYRKALSKEEAIKEIEYCSGTQFDPVLVKTFIDIMKE